MTKRHFVPIIKVRMIPNHKNKQETLREQQESRLFESEAKLPEAKEIAEKLEAVEIPSNVSEVTEKPSEKKRDGISPAAKAAQVKKVKEDLLKNLPPEKVMRSEVKSAVRKEISQLERQKLRIIHNPANRDFNKLNIIVQKLRELRNIIASLAEATYEMLKNLWLRFVHGIY